MDDFFLKHDVYKDKDPDEAGPTARGTNSDSEASDDETATFASASDPMGPWKQEKVLNSMKNKLGHSITRSKNSGPKGVINDHKEYQQAKAIERERNQLIRQAVIDRITKGHITPASEATQEDIAIPTKSDNDTESDDDGIFDDPDANILQKYREDRMKELQNTDTRPVFGEFKHVTPFEFLDIVDRADGRSFVVVHLFEGFLPACQLVNTCFESLARKHIYIQFLAMTASEADNEITHEGLPVIMIYRGGELLESILDVNKKLKGDISSDNIEWILDEHINIL